MNVTDIIQLHDMKHQLCLSFWEHYVSKFTQASLGSRIDRKVKTLTSYKKVT